jgi:uncharacterized protein YdhG (YjbR/CyaY superfamily)
MKKSMKSAPATIDDYLDELPSEVKAVLEKIRQTIRSAVPKAEEVISYGMPGFRYYGMLVYFAAFKNHCSLFPAGAMTTLKKEIEPYRTSKGTLQFTVDKPIPITLVKKIAKVRKEENEAKHNAKLLAKKSATKKPVKKRAKH